MDKNYPNVIIFHGKLDKKVNYISSLFFKKEKYSKTRVVLMDNIGHDLEKLFDIKKINKLI